MSAAVGSKRWRQTFGRAKAGRCYTHNLPVEQSLFFDGGRCPLGCVWLNTVVAHHLARFRRENFWRRRGS